MRFDRPPVPPYHVSAGKVDPGALENLQFIRDTMARSASFTAVPGWGAIAMGVIALIAAVYASFSVSHFLTSWCLAAVSAMTVGSIALVRKANSQRASLLSGPGRKFILGLCPCLFSGALLTYVLYTNGLVALLPGTWLLLYGSCVVAAGTFSIRIVPITGTAFMMLGAVSLFLPLELGNWMLAAGFGGLHIASGFVIARRFGG